PAAPRPLFSASSCHRHLRPPPSFPTRRSSDLGERFDAVLVRDHADIAVERVGAAVKREQRLAVFGAADREVARHLLGVEHVQRADRKSTRLNSSHVSISYAVFCLTKKTRNNAR